MKKIYFTLSILILTFSLSIAQGDGIRFTEGSWQEILELAKKENKLIFMDAYTSWCGPCKKMSKEIFPQRQVGSFYNDNFINVKMNMEKGEGTMLADKYEVIAYPTLLFIASDETLVHRVAGYHDANEFISLGETAVDPSNNLAAMDQRYKKGNREPAFLMAYTAARYNAMDGTHSTIAEAYLATQKDWNTSDIRKFIMQYSDQVNTPMFNYLIANKTDFIQQFGEKDVVGKIQNILHSHLHNQENSTLEAVNELFSKVYPEKGKQLASHYRMTYYRTRGDREGFAKSAIDHFKKYPTKDASELNDIAWTFYEVIDNPALLEGGIGLAKKSIKAKKQYSNMDTLAALYKKIGNKKKALKTAKKAIKIAKKSNEDYSLTEDLIKEIENM